MDPYSIYVDILLPGCLFIAVSLHKTTHNEAKQNTSSQPVTRFSLSSDLLEPEQASASCNHPQQARERHLLNGAFDMVPVSETR